MIKKSLTVWLVAAACCLPRIVAAVDNGTPSTLTSYFADKNLTIECKGIACISGFRSKDGPGNTTHDKLIDSNQLIAQNGLPRDIGISTKTLSSATSAPASGTGPVPANFFGMHVINGNYPTVPFGAIRASGVSWPSIEGSRGTYQWSRLDSQVNTALAHNLKIVYTTSNVPSWAAKNQSTCGIKSCSSGVANLADWDAFVTALVQRYKGKIEAYELWNDPDTSFTGPMSDFLPLAQHFHDIVRANDPAALVLSPGPSDVSWLDLYWAAGGVKDVDAVQFNGILSAPVPENLAAEKTTPLRAILSRYGLSATPVWDASGLWGDPSALTDLAAQAAFVARYHLLHWSNGVSRLYWYSWDDNGTGANGQGWGALANWQTGVAYAAGVAYGQVYNWMLAATMSTPCSASSDNTWTCTLTKAGGYQALAVWNPSSNKQYTPVGNFTQYRDLTGNVKAVSGPVAIGSQPILLEATGTPPPPTLQITTSSLPGGQIHSAYSASLAASGGAPPYAWSITTGTLPAGMNLNASTGAITGTPTTSGPSAFTVQARDSASAVQTAVRQLSITIATPPPPTLQITTSSLPGGQMQSAYSASLAASGGAPPYAWSVTIGTLPAGLNLNASTGAITGTPSTSGPSAFTVQVRDSASAAQTAARQLSITIVAPPPPTLRITTSSLPGGQAQNAYSANLSASGGAPPYAWSITTGTLPAGLNLNASTGAITGTPATSGPTTFTVRVADAGTQSASAPLSITIVPVTPPGTSAIPGIFFGMHMQEQSTNWPTVSIGAYRTSAVSWPRLEAQKGTFTWGEMDRQVALAQQHGVPVYYATDGIPSWFSSSNLADWDNFITAMATRYKGKIEIYELWNEPEYDTLPPIATFAVMTQHMRDIIRSIDPSAKIASPGVDTISYIDKFWAAGGPKDVDVVALHGYPYGSQPETIVQKATEMRGYMSKYGVNKPLYDSEGSFGDPSYGVTSTADKTNFIPRYELLQWSNGITRHYWYSWDDSASATNGIGWGTLYNAVTKQILPMAATYQQTYNWMVGATLTTPCSMASDSTWTCGLTRRGGYQAMAIWNPSTSRQYTPAGIYTQYKDLSGNVKPVSGSVTIGPAAILLEAVGGTTPPPVLQITTSSLPGAQTGSSYTAKLAATGGTTPYSWSITTGSLPAGLTLNASSGGITGTPTVATLSAFTVRVSDSGASPQSTSAQVSIIVSATTPPTPMQITTSGLPSGQVQSAYTAVVAATGGTAPYSWSIAAGSLPPGLTLNATTGAISGTPSASGTSTFTVRAADSASGQQTASRQFSVIVAPAPLKITTTNLPNGQVQSPYIVTLSGQGGAPPYTWAAFGALPSGLALNASTGTISGTPITASASPATFSIQLTDGASQSTAMVPFTITVSAASTATVFNHVVIVLEENSNYTNTIGSSSMPYLNSLATQYGLATQYYANTHPSIGNYLWIVTGQQITDDDSQVPSSLPVSVDNVVRQLLAAGKTWKSYSENLPSAGYVGGDSGSYAVRHNPFAYLSDVQNNAAQRQNLVPFTQFKTDLANGTLPNYSFITPNLCNDAHDCGLATADSWLQTNIAPLVNNANFQKDGLLIITFDESENDNTHGGGRIPLILVSPQARQHFQSATLYQHPSLLRLSLQALGVKSWPGAAATAAAMSEFFTVPLP